VFAGIDFRILVHALHWLGWEPRQAVQFYLKQIVYSTLARDSAWKIEEKWREYLRIPDSGSFPPPQPGHLSPLWEKISSTSHYF
jgi:hypothetical protein